MDTSRSLEEFGEALRRRYREQELREKLAALSVLREYFVEAAGISSIDRLRPAEVRDFALQWLLRSDDGAPETAAVVLALLGEWLRMFPAPGTGALAPDMAALVARLERDVPRALAALAEMRAALVNAALPGAAVELEDET